MYHTLITCALILTAANAFAQTPAGRQNAVQYNNGSAFAGNEAGFSFDGTNVGIGTPAPRSLLEIRKDQNTYTTLEVYNFTNGTNAAAEISVNAASPSGKITAAIASFPPNFTGCPAFAGKAVVGAVGSATGLVLLSSTPNSDIEFAVGGYGANFERMRLLSTGNLGIGSTAPGAVLDVNGSARLVAAGSKLFFKEGSNACTGISTLSGGAVTVNTACITSDSRVSLTLQNCFACGAVYLGAVTPGRFFVINSTNEKDGSKVYWQIVDRI